MLVAEAREAVAGGMLAAAELAAAVAVGSPRNTVMRLVLWKISRET
jgi:hypothetical protein